ncbi:hypothetical protein OC842_007405 [Tilletia horrida]|uniref:Uncharacterized protein n=1 Tax=Tilletia horrida TaxID=155126 RepID=A0AAN6G6R3_9BASI|nr:hypothetical protein OC842_007405 [Tilletia horrida]
MGPRGGGASGGGIGSTPAQKDSSTPGPIALGMITLLNAELSAYRTTRERKGFESDAVTEVGGASTDSTGASKLRTAAAAATPSHPPPAASVASREHRARSSSAPSPVPRRLPTPSQRSLSSFSSASTSACPAQAPAGDEPRPEVRKASLRTAMSPATIRAAT